MESVPAVEAQGVSKTFRRRTGERVRALDDVSFRASRGEITAVTGPSGSGKTTLLQVLAGLERPDAGTVRIGDREVTALRDGALTRFRRRSIGFVFQDFNLMPNLSAHDNIALPMRLDGREADEQRLLDLAERLEIADRLGHRPSELSGGQQQRVAVARALLAEPEVVFADEPTGALDAEAATALLDLIGELAHERGQSLVVVTHDRDVVAWADRVHRLEPDPSLVRGSV